MKLRPFLKFIKWLLILIAFSAAALYYRSQQLGALIFSITALLATFAVGRLRSPRIFGPGLLFTTLTLLIILPEIWLRIFGFSFDRGMSLVWPSRGLSVSMQPDKDLFWVLPRGERALPQGWDNGISDVNLLGFPGPEIVSPKPADIYRILFLGDSCTWQGYPKLVAQLLNQQANDHDSTKHLKFESVSFAVPGYSSYQGLKAAQKYAALVQADAVVVFFGWNDHWLGHGASDAQRVDHGDSKYIEQLNSVRIAQLAYWLAHKVRKNSSPAHLRVPLDSYRKNLEKIGNLFDNMHSKVVFVTAPSSMYASGIPAGFIQMGFFPAELNLPRVHREYNNVVRQVSTTSSNYLLLDLAQTIDGLKDVNNLFLTDTVHFSPAGLNFVADQLTQFLSQNVIPDKRSSNK